MKRREDAIGMIETNGLVAAIEAADAMVKTANVTVVRYEQPGGSLVTIIVEGSVADVKAAVDAGAQRARVIGELNACHVIARFSGEADDLLEL